MFRKIILFLIFVLSFGGAIFAQTTSQNSPNDMPTPKILFKSQAKYTDAAREKSLEGKISLRVTFLASGEIGDVVDVTKKKRKKFEKYGLTAEAVKAARTIRFEPARKNGVPITVTKIVVFEFTVY